MIPLGTLAGSRHGGGGTPDSIAGLDLWLQGDSLVGLANNAPIESWPDSSPAGNDATQLTTTRQPTFSTSKGFPSVWFLRTSTGPRFLRSSAPSSGPAQTSFVVATVGDNDVRTPLGGADERSFGLDSSNRWVRAALWKRRSVSLTEVETLPAGTIMAFGGMLDVSTTSMSVWRGLHPMKTTTGPLELIDGQTIRIGTKGTLDDPHYGYIFEVIHYSRVLTEPERLDVMGYLMTKYGIVDGP